MALNVSLLKESFEVAKPIAGDVVDYFYQTLFADYPEAKRLFKLPQMAKQKKALIGSLVFIVDNVDNPDKLVPYLKQMGARHQDYQVTPEQYGWVAQSMMKTLAHFFADKWSPELSDTWNGALSTVAEVMLSGYQEKAQPVDLQAVAREEARKILHQEFQQIASSPQFREVVREKIVEVMVAALNEEVNACLKRKAG